MSEVALLHDLAQGAIWREQHLRDRADMLTESDDWLISCFRLLRPILLHLCNILEPNLMRPTKRSCEICDPATALPIKDRACIITAMLPWSQK